MVDGVVLYVGAVTVYGAGVAVGVVHTYGATGTADAIVALFVVARAVGVARAAMPATATRVLTPIVVCIANISRWGGAVDVLAARTLIMWSA